MLMAPLIKHFNAQIMFTLRFCVQLQLCIHTCAFIKYNKILERHEKKRRSKKRNKGEMRCIINILAIKSANGKSKSQF